MIKSNQRLWKHSEIAESILAGDTLVIYRDQVLRISHSWLNTHPGGALAILHYVGRDATDEIEAFHAAHALKRVNQFVVGCIEATEEGWQPLIPPIASGWTRRVGLNGPEWARKAEVESSTMPKTSEKNLLNFDGHNYAPSEILLVEKSTSPATSPSLSTLNPPPTTLSLATQTRHARAFRELHKKIEDAGLYQTPYLRGYGPEVLRYLLLALVSIIAYQHGWFLASGIFLGLYWHQVTFTVHDLGHMGVTHDWTLDRIIAMAIADFTGGLSPMWWVEVCVFLALYWLLTQPRL
jgi:delta8-fatty-acid desaturase